MLICVSSCNVESIIAMAVAQTQCGKCVMGDDSIHASGVTVVVWRGSYKIKNLLDIVVICGFVSYAGPDIK